MALIPVGYTAANRRTIKLMVEQAAPLFEDGSAPMFMVMGEAIAAIAVGKLFYAMAPAGAPYAGEKRLYLRTDVAPYYEDQGNSAAPASRARVDAAAAQNQQAVAALADRQDQVEETVQFALSSSSYRPTPAEGADLPVDSYFLAPNVGDGGTVWVYKRIAGAPGYTAIQRQEVSADQIADGTAKVSMTMAERLRQAGGNRPELSGVAGTANAITATMPAGLTALADGQRFVFYPASTNTADAPTLAIGGGDALPITTASGGVIRAGELVSGQPYEVRVSAGASRFALSGGFGTRAALLTDTPLAGNPTAAQQSRQSNSDRLANTSFVQDQMNFGRTLANVAGSNTVTADAPIALTAYAAGQEVSLKKSATNTGAVTLNLGGLGALPVTLNGNALTGGEMVTGRFYRLRNQSGTSWEIVSSSEGETTIVPSAVKAAQQASNLSAQRPNLFIAEEIDTTAAIRSGNGSTAIIAAASFNGAPCWEVSFPINASERGIWFGPFSRREFAALGSLCASFEILSLSAYAGASSTQKARMLMRQYDASGATLVTTQVDITSGNAAVDLPFTVATPEVALHADTALVWVYLGALNVGGADARTLRFRNPLIAAGGGAAFRRSIGQRTPKLLAQHTLPANVSNPNTEGYGFTCTGLCRAHNGLWAIANVGVATEDQNAETPPNPAYFAPSIVFTTPDGRVPIKEILLRPLFPGIRSIQGLALDTSNSSYWFADIASRRLRNISYDGAPLASIYTDASVIPGWTTDKAVNGLAYDPVQHGLWANVQGTTSIYLIDIATSTIVKTLAVTPTDIDHMHYDPSTKYLWWTRGANGVDGTVTIFDTVSGKELRTITCAGSKAIEGVFYDANQRRLYTANDQGLHVTAGIAAVANISVYEFEL